MLLGIPKQCIVGYSLTCPIWQIPLFFMKYQSTTVRNNNDFWAVSSLTFFSTLARVTSWLMYVYRGLQSCVYTDISNDLNSFKNVRRTTKSATTKIVVLSVDKAISSLMFWLTIKIQEIRRWRRGRIRAWFWALFKRTKYLWVKITYQVWYPQDFHSFHSRYWMKITDW